MCRLALGVAVLALITSLMRPDAAQASFQRVHRMGMQHSRQRPAGLPSLVPRICAGSSVRVRRILGRPYLSKYGPSLSLPR